MAGTKSFCTVCNLMLNSFEQFTAHQTGKAHKRKLAAGPSSTTPTSSEQVTKIVRAKPFIRFVSSQESNAPESSQNNSEGGDTGQAADSSSCPDASTFKSNDLFCSICVVKLTSQALADMHYAGAKHKRAVSLTGRSGSGDTGEGVKRKFEEVCEVCNVPLISKVVAEAHYAGSKHEKKLRLSQNINSTNPCPSFSGSVLRPASIGGGAAGQPKRKAPIETFFCHFCKVTLNSQMQLDAHYQGIKHKCAVNGTSPPRKKPFIPRPPQEPPYTPRPPQEPPYTPRPPQELPYAARPPLPEERFSSPSHHYQGGHFGKPNGFGNHSAPGPFRSLPPAMLYPQY